MRGASCLGDRYGPLWPPVAGGCVRLGKKTYPCKGATLVVGLPVGYLTARRLQRFAEVLNPHNRSWWAKWSVSRIGQYFWQPL